MSSYLISDENKHVATFLVLPYFRGARRLGLNGKYGGPNFLQLAPDVAKYLHWRFAIHIRAVMDAIDFFPPQLPIRRTIRMT